jgi:hypothetical protein
MGHPRMQDLTRKQELAIASALVVVFVFVAYSWIVTPHVASLRACQQYERAASIYAEKSQEVNQTLRTEQAQLRQLAAQCALFSDGAFGAARAQEFLSDLEVFCGQSSCTVVSLSYMSDNDTRPVGENGNTSSSPIVTRGAALTVCATYNSIVRLIEILQARPEKVWVDALRMGTSKLNPGKVACDLVITIYVNLDKESSGDEQIQVQP